jgi:hypothetical protein
MKQKPKPVYYRRGELRLRVQSLSQLSSCVRRTHGCMFSMHQLLVVPGVNDIVRKVDQKLG